MLAATISVSKSALGMASTYGKPPPSFEQQYAKQLEVFDCSLFPVEDYSMRNAASRKDGYWPYVSRKEEPPSDLVYGEFPLPFFHRVLQRACVHAGIGADRSEATFADLGSGSGRLVLWAAASDQWARCVGVELLSSLHEAAVKALEEAQADGCPLAPLPTPAVDLYKGSWDDESLLAWSELDVCFAYTTAFDHGPDNKLHELSEALSPNLRRGCIVCTTDYQLAPEAGFELVEELDGPNEGVGGMSVAYIHRKTVGGRSEAKRQEAIARRLAARCAELEAALEARKVEVTRLSERCESLEEEKAALQAANEELIAELDATGSELLGDDAWAGYAASLAEGRLQQGEGRGGEGESTDVSMGTGAGEDAERFTSRLRAQLLGGEEEEEEEEEAEEEEQEVEEEEVEPEDEPAKRKKGGWWPW